MTTPNTPPPARDSTLRPVTPSDPLLHHLRPARFPRAGRRSIVLAAVSATEESAPPSGPNATAIAEATVGGRATEARARARARLRHQREALRPLAMAIIVVVVVSTAASDPAPGLHGRSLGITLALVTFAGALGFASRGAFADLLTRIQAATIATMGAAGVALTVLQPHSATGLAVAAAAWMAFARLPAWLGLPLGASLTVAQAVGGAVAGISASGVLATTLLCALLALIARFMKQARESEERAEVLLARLEDARDEQARAAAVAERGRIASELHDVLAHSLSGAAIQLQGARLLAEREQAGPRVQDAIERAAALVKDGLASAREAVGALRGTQLPGVAQLPSLIESYRHDLHVIAALEVEGDARALPAEADLGLYRGAQEALTNVARHAPGASASVILRYGTDGTFLTVENGAGTGAAASEVLAGVGGGRGLDGMRERIERAGGTMRAGATDAGWRVELEVPW